MPKVAVSRPCLEHELHQVDYCVVDLETSGFSPAQGEILEIGAVRVNASGQMVDAFSTLVQPRGPIAGTDVHGITAADVAHAPRLEAVGGHLARLMDGAVLVSYNIYFDHAFLRAHLLDAAGVDPDLPRLCCMYLRGLIGKEPPRTKLADALAEQGLPGGNAHTAFDDAMATSLLLQAYLADAQQRGLATFADLAEQGTYKFLSTWSQPLVRWTSDAPTSPPVARSGAFEVGQPADVATPVPPPVPSPTRPVFSLPRLIDRVWTTLDAADPSLDGAEAYLAVLCDALSDRVLTPKEMADLVDCARFYGLEPPRVAELHEALYEEVVAHASADGPPTAEEQADLDLLRSLLGVGASPPTLPLASPPRRLGRVALAAMGVAIGAYLLAVGALFLAGGAAPAGQADVAIVYGNTVHPNGEPSDRLKARLDAALELFEADQVERVLVSGGVGAEGHDEAAVMAAYLTARGVPSEQVLIDPLGITTERTSRNAAAVLEPDAAVVAVSQRFHVSRAMMSLRHAGFTDVRGHPARYHELRDVYAYTREIPAWLSYWWQQK